MTTFKALTPFILENRLISEISDLDGDKFAVNNDWGTFRSWFIDNRDKFFVRDGGGSIYFKNNEVISDLMGLMKSDPVVSYGMGSQRFSEYLAHNYNFDIGC